MSKEEIIISLPKNLLTMLENEKYLGYDRKYFFEAAVRGLVSCTINSWPFNDMKGFYEKYGRKVDVIYLPKC